MVKSFKKVLYSKSLQKMTTTSESGIEQAKSQVQPEHYLIRRAMIVDDEDIVRNAMTRVVTHMLNYEVEAYAHGEAAYERLTHVAEKMPHHYAFVLSDVRMPGMNGITLAQKAFEILPRLPFLLMTGYNSIDEDKRPGNVRDILVKPIGIHHLAEVVRLHIEQPAA
jgi:CheY-like chemotaxis protein